MDGFGVGDKVYGEVEARRAMENSFNIGTTWDFECYDRDGNLKWEDRNRPNIVTHEGLDFLLDVMFHGTAAIATWYVAPVETDTAAAATMTYAVPAYTEWDGYSEAVRQLTQKCLSQIFKEEFEIELHLL